MTTSHAQLLSLFGLLLVCSLANCDQPTLEVSPIHHSPLRADRATLTCSLRGNEEDTANYALSWAGPDTLNNSEDLAKTHKLTGDSTTLELTLTSFGPEQAGTYTCLAKPKSSKLPSFNQTIEVYRDVEPAISRCPEKQNFVAGSTGKIVCSFNLRHKLFTVDLFKDDRKAGNRYKYDSASESFLIDGAVNMTDDGQYHIIARFRPFPVKIRQNITVVVSQPTSAPKPSSATGSTGQALSLQDPTYAPYVICGALVCSVILIILDLMCCWCFAIGVSYAIRSRCCPTKATSVITDKITSDTT